MPAYGAGAAMPVHATEEMCQQPKCDEAAAPDGKNQKMRGYFPADAKYSKSPPIEP
jgi:hypothetical protein